ncbi:D-inositol-3-phosphate glycosyltransferase [Nocardia sp. RB56]|uniref:UDP-N-acetylglucosamine kinase n=2 Tax=Nocardia aurantia TaxID=2585199 RepID=A0A7K0DH68_9NOCA|nr:D-inositol-3-phosphate glycosyltransferase [Nocardia aurantia]
MAGLNFGSAYPKGNQDELFALGDAWKKAAAELEQLEPELRHVSGGLSQSYTGAGAEAILAEFAALLDGSDTSLPALVDSLNQLGHDARSTAAEIEYTKIQAELFALLTLYTVLQLMTTLYGSLAVPPVLAISREALAVFARTMMQRIAAIAARAASRTLAKGIAKEVVIPLAERVAASTPRLLATGLRGGAAMGVMGAGVDAGVQAIQLGEHHLDDGFDLKKTFQTSVEWGAGGLVGGPAHLKIADLLNNRGTPKWLGGLLSGGLGGMAGGVGMYAGGLGNQIYDHFQNGKSIDWSLSPQLLVGGAALGGVGGLRHGMRGAPGGDGSGTSADHTGRATGNSAASGSDRAHAVDESRTGAPEPESRHSGNATDESGAPRGNRAEPADGTTDGRGNRPETAVRGGDSKTANRAGPADSNGGHTARPVTDGSYTVPAEHGNGAGRAEQPRLERISATLTGIDAVTPWRPTDAAAHLPAPGASHPAAAIPMESRGPVGLESPRADTPVTDGSAAKPVGQEQVRQPTAAGPAPESRGGASPEKLPYAEQPRSGVQAGRTSEAVAANENRSTRPTGDGSTPVSVAAALPMTPHVEPRPADSRLDSRRATERRTDGAKSPSYSPARPVPGERPENAADRRRPAGPAELPDEVAPGHHESTGGGVTSPESADTAATELPYETHRTFDENGDRVTKLTVRVHFPEGFGEAQRDHADAAFRQATEAMTGSDPRLLHGDRLELGVRFVEDPAHADLHLPADSAAGLSPDAAIRQLRDHLGLPDSGVAELSAGDLRAITDRISVSNTAPALHGLPETREFGPGKLRDLEHPAYQEQLRDSCREDDHFVIGADPRTHPMGEEINDGGPEVAGRGNDCVEACLAALSTFHGDPQVALPRYLDEFADGTVDYDSGEAGGMDRAGNWLGGNWQEFPPDMAIADQFQALHDFVHELGPGTSAMVVNEWQAVDENTGAPLYHSDGTPMPEDSHASLVVFPLEAEGPVWWDPQLSLTSDHPPTYLVDGSMSLEVIVLLPDGSPFSAVADSHHSGSTGVPGSGPRLHSDLSDVPVRTRLDMHPEPDRAGAGRTAAGREESIGTRRPDRGDHPVPEPGSKDHRRVVHEGDPGGYPHAGRPDLPADDPGASAADQRRTHPSDLPGRDRIAGESGPADGRLSPGHRQANRFPDSTEFGDEPARKSAEEPISPRRNLADPGDIRVLNEADRSGHGPADRHEQTSHPDHDAAPENRHHDPAADIQTGGSTRPHNPLDEPAQRAWADDAYSTIRASDTDVRDAVANLSGVVRADGSIGFTATEIAAIKQHLFVDEHKLSVFDDNGTVVGYEQRRFDADADIAEAWMRLSRGEPLPPDVTLLEHELAEADYLRRYPDASYREAHEYANSKAHWENRIPGRTGENHERWGETDRTVPGLPEDRRDPGRGDVPVREQRNDPGSRADHPQGRRGRDSGGRSIGPAADEGGRPNPDSAHDRPDLAWRGRDSGLTERLPVEDKPYYGNPEYRDPAAEREYARTAKLDEAIRIRADNAVDHPEIARLSDADIAIIRRNQDVNLNQAVNEATRDGDSTLLGRHDTEIRALINAYNKLPDHQGRVLRSLYIDDPAKLTKFMDEYRQGNIVPDRGFASADKESSLIGGNIELIIDSRSGKDISWASTWQDEVVFPPGTEFRVRTVVPRDGKVYIHLEDLGRNADAHHTGGVGRNHAEGGGAQRHPAPAVPREPGDSRPQHGVHRGTGSSRAPARDGATGRDLAGVGRVGAPPDRPGARPEGRVADSHPPASAAQHTPAHPYSQHELQQAQHARQARERFRPVPPEHGSVTEVPRHGSGGRLAFEVRRHTDAPGGPITVVTVRAHVTVDSRVPSHEMNRLWENTQFACDTAFNHGRLLPSGDRLLVDLVHTSDAAAAHLHIHADPQQGAPWQPRNHPRLLADHLRAQLGLGPEPYRGHGLAPHELRQLGEHIDAAQHPAQYRPSVHEAGYTTGERTPAGVSHHDDPGLRHHARLVPPDHFHFTADVHLTPDGHAVIGGHRYTATEYANLLRHGSMWTGREPIRLLGCDGATNGFAAELARHLGVDVTAPTHSAWTDNHGRVYTSAPEVDAYGNRRPRIPPDGHWETFPPDGTSIRTSADGFAPFTPETHKSGLDPAAARERAADGEPGDRAPRAGDDTRTRTTGGTEHGRGDPAADPRRARDVLASPGLETRSAGGTEVGDRAGVAGRGDRHGGVSRGLTPDEPHTGSEAPEAGRSDGTEPHRSEAAQRLQIGDRVVVPEATHTLAAEEAARLRELGQSTPELHELNPADADLFREKMLELREGNRFAASVHVYEVDDYRAMRLLVTDDGRAGVALKGDEIVSAFAQRPSKYPGAAGTLIGIAVELGGRRLDCFDTVLPKLYAESGFVPVARVRWNDEYAPPGWDYDTFHAFNGGRPDVVFMAYDPAAVGSRYEPGAGRYVGDYDAGVEAARGHRIFYEEIVPELLSEAASVPHSEKPELVVIGGQTGAGKSTMIAEIKNSFAERGGVLHLSGDDFFKFHPRYAELMRGVDADGIRHLVPDIVHWFGMAIDHAIENRQHVILELAMADPVSEAATMRNFIDHDYTARAEVIAVPESQSRLSMISRYLGERVDNGVHRYTPPTLHDASYTGSQEMVRQLESADPPARVEALTVRDRNGVLFENTRTPDGRWAAPPRAEEILAHERERAWTAAEQRGYREQLADVRRRIAEMAELRPDESATLTTLHRELRDTEALARPRLESPAETAALPHQEHTGPPRDTAVPEPGEAAARQTRTQEAAQHVGAGAVEQHEFLHAAERHDLAGAAPELHERIRANYARAHEIVDLSSASDKAGLRILALIDEWHPSKGGVISVNKNLCEALSDLGHEIFVRVSHPVTGNEGAEKVTLIPPRDPADNSMRGNTVIDMRDLPPGVDVVLGHSRFSGPAAAQVRNTMYPQATLVHMVHMVTDSLARVKGEFDRAVTDRRIEADMVSAADVAVGVGPTLAEEATRLAELTGSDAVLHQLIPGIEFFDQVRPPGDRQTMRMLVFGRADDPVKGAMQAAKMVNELNERGVDVDLIVRGVPVAKLEDQHRLLVTAAGRDVDVRPYTLDRGDILADMHDANVVLMPSRAEGFGLVATEAAGAGVPIVVPSSSGAGRFFGDHALFPNEVTDGMLVEQGVEDHVSVDRWADILEAQLSNQDIAWDRALLLQQIMRDRNFTWESAGAALIDAIGMVPPREYPVIFEPDDHGRPSEPSSSRPSEMGQD